MKRFFIEYLETRDQLVIVNTPSLVIKTSFSQGVNVSRYSGHSRKKDALEHIQSVIMAAGKQIAVYHGPVIV